MKDLRTVLAHLELTEGPLNCPRSFRTITTITRRPPHNSPPRLEQLEP